MSEMGEKRMWTYGPGQELLAEVAERSLVPPSGIGSVAIRDELLATAEEGARMYAGVIDSINAKRDKKDQIPTLKPGEYRYRAEDWLTDNLSVAATHLPVAEDRRLLLIPRLNRAITIQETFEAWEAASDRGVSTLRSRKKLHHHWSADELSGFDPEMDPDEVQFQVLPTAYDKKREGTPLEQNKRLEALQIEVPELRVAAIFDGAVLAMRYKGQPRASLDTYVRAIDLQPTRVGRFDSVPAGNVSDFGFASVGVSNVQNFLAARLVVRNI